MAMTMLLGAAPVEAADFDHSHGLWTTLLQSHVSGGVVDYAAIKRSGQLRAYLKELESVTPAQINRFSQSQQLAFWLNVYNAYTVALIVDKYPLDSIREIGVLPFAAFRKDFIELPATGMDEASLNHVEHEIVRKQFAEPRVHFAMVCAALSCPPLRSEAYRAVDLEPQLDQQARTFFNNSSKNRWDPKKGVLHLSKILEWFADDFTKTGKTIPAYVAQYLEGLDPAAVNEIEHLDYDWALNGK